MPAAVRKESGVLDILGLVRTVFAALLACLLVVVTTGDRFACPDGCTDEAPAQTASQHLTPSCAICHGWSHAPVVVASRPAPRLIVRDAIVIANPTDPALPTVELPPKPA
jgi:hypothetical protein